MCFLVEISEEILEGIQSAWHNIVTPVNVSQLTTLLIESNYDLNKTMKLRQQFTEGFDIGYRGPTDRADNSQNIPLSVGTPTDRWNKVMQEVK